MFPRLLSSYDHQQYYQEKYSALSFVNIVFSIIHALQCKYVFKHFIIPPKLASLNYLVII